MDETAEGGLSGKILLVDDSEEILLFMEAVLQGKGIEFHSARDGREGVETAKRILPDLVFLDISMPVMDGFQACRLLREDPDTANIPVVMVTAHTDRESRIQALRAGANDFLGKPIDGTELVVRVRNLLKVKQYQDFLVEHTRILERRVEERTRQLTEALLDTVRRLTLTSEYRDEDTYVHVKRISYYTSILVKYFDIPKAEAEIMFFACPMHDIGKVGIPDSILLKPGVLTGEEFEVMKTHTAIGARILRGSDSPFLRSAEKFALYHHERWDGTGYPYGLKGEEIPVEGRILNLIDQYDALRSRRPYKPAYTHEQAAEILLEGNPRTRPGHFDPRVLKAFRENLAAFEEIFETHQI